MMQKEVVVEKIDGIPRRGEALEGVIARHVRSAVWHRLYDLYQDDITRIRFRDLFALVREEIMAEFPELDKFRRDYFILCCIVLGSNIALFSVGGELWICYAHLLKELPEYRDFFQVIPGKGNSRLMREVARDELQYSFKISARAIREVFRKKHKLPFNIRALFVRKGDFVIMPEKDAVYVTTYNRVLLDGRKLY